MKTLTAHGFEVMGEKGGAVIVTIGVVTGVRLSRQELFAVFLGL